MFCRLVRLRGDHGVVILGDEHALFLWHEHASITRKGYGSFISLLHFVGVSYFILPISELACYFRRSMIVKEVLLLPTMSQHVAL